MTEERWVQRAVRAWLGQPAVHRADANRVSDDGGSGSRANCRCSCRTSARSAPGVRRGSGDRAPRSGARRLLPLRDVATTAFDHSPRLDRNSRRSGAAPTARRLPWIAARVRLPPLPILPGRCSRRSSLDDFPDDCPSAARNDWQSAQCPLRLQDASRRPPLVPVNVGLAGADGAQGSNCWVITATRNCVTTQDPVRANRRVTRADGRWKILSRSVRGSSNTGRSGSPRRMPDAWRREFVGMRSGKPSPPAAVVQLVGAGVAPDDRSQRAARAGRRADDLSLGRRARTDALLGARPGAGTRRDRRLSAATERAGGRRGAQARRAQPQRGGTAAA